MKKLFMIFSVIAFLGLGATAFAYNPWTGPATDTLSGSEIVGTDGWSDAIFEYAISESGGLWTYNYTFTDPGGDVLKALSHLIIQVSDNFTSDNIYDGTTPGGSLGSYSGDDPSNPGLPFPITGIKFDATGDPTEYSVTIVTDKSPMEGIFYAKDGVFNPGSIQVYAYNNYLDDYWIPVPDTTGGGNGEVPEPATMLLLGSGLIGLAGIGRRKFFKK